MGPMTIQEAINLAQRTASSWRQLCDEALETRGPPHVIDYERRRDAIQEEMRALNILMAWAMIGATDERQTLGEILAMFDELGFDPPDPAVIDRMRRGG